MTNPASDWPVAELSPDPVVEVTPPPAPASAATEREVDRLWDAARAGRPGLFDGRVFSADRIEPDRIVGHWTRYRRVLAQIARPALFGELRVRSLAVNGVLRTPDGIVFGRRDPRAVYQPGMWQCPPAGSVESRNGDDAVDLAAQVLAELEEELGLPPDAIDRTGIRALCAVEHPGSHVVDLGIALPCGWSFDRVRARHAATGNDEYHDLVAVPETALAEHLARWGCALVPPAHAFCARIGGEPVLRRRTGRRSPR